MEKRDLLETLKYCTFDELNSIDEDVSELTKDMNFYVSESVLLHMWIHDLLFHKKLFENDLLNSEAEIFMDRLIDGIAYAVNPDNKMAIEILQKNIMEQRQERTVSKEIDFAKTIFGIEYLNKKTKILHIFKDVKESFDLFSSKVFDIYSLIDQMIEIVEGDKSLEDDFVTFMNNDKIKFLCRLNDVCNYINNPTDEKIMKLDEKLKTKN